MYKFSQLKSAIPVVETHNAVSDDIDPTYSTIQDSHTPINQQRYIFDSASMA